MKKVAIIGAGITGATTAHMLLKKGYDVTVFDRHDYAAMETSFANGGQLSASNAEVWNQWSTVMKGMKWLFKKDAPLSINLMPNFHKYSWLTEFLWATKDYEKNTKDTVKLAIQARAHLNAIADEYAIDFNHEKRGILHFYRKDKSFKSALKANKLLVAGGLERNELAPSDITKIEPALQGSGDFVGGFFTKADSTGDIHKFSKGVLTAVAKRGVTNQFGANVTSVKADDNGVQILWTDNNDPEKTQDARFDSVVICAGVNSGKFAAMVGDRVNVYPMKGYSITVNVPQDTPKDFAPWVSLLDDDAKIVTSRLGQDRYRVAGTAEINGYNRDIRADRIQPLVNWVRENHVNMDTSQCVPWAGLRPMMANMMPVVRRGKQKNVYFNTGHGHLGWTLSAATAEIISNIIEADTTRQTRNDTHNNRGSEDLDTARAVTNQRHTAAA